jgi:hypothetical protein
LGCLVLRNLNHFDSHQCKLEQRHHLTSHFPNPVRNLPRFHDSLVFIDWSYDCNHHFHQHHNAGYQSSRLTIRKLF